MASFGLPWMAPRGKTPAPRVDPIRGFFGALSGQEGLVQPDKSKEKEKALEKKRAQPKCMSIALGLVKYLPALVLGFALGVAVRGSKGGDGGGSSGGGGDGGAKPWELQGSRAKNKAFRLRSGSSQVNVGTSTGESSSSTRSSDELKMVFVVRQDLKMGGGKVASQCALDDASASCISSGEFSADFRSDFDAAVGIYTELVSRQRPLLNRWEECGQPKIVVTCKNQQEMLDLKYKAEQAGLPTYTVSDAGRTQVAAGSKTVLVIGPGPKDVVDSITRHLRLL